MFLDILAVVVVVIAMFTVGFPTIGLIFCSPPKTYSELWIFGVKFTTVIAGLAISIVSVAWAMGRISQLL